MTRFDQGCPWQDETPWVGAIVGLSEARVLAEPIVPGFVISDSPPWRMSDRFLRRVVKLIGCLP
jgi:hypothetical protein